MYGWGVGPGGTAYIKQGLLHPCPIGLSFRTELDALLLSLLLMTRCMLHTAARRCFSHFTYSFSDGRDLLCDVQGVWNAVDGFVLTGDLLTWIPRPKLT